MEDFQNAKLETSGMQCDSCDWIGTESVSIEELHNWLGKPCPKCGANLLTEEDYQNALMLEQALKVVNSLSSEQIDEINKLAAQNPNYKNPFEDLEIDLNLPVSVTIETHKGIKITNIRQDKDEK